MTNPLDRAQPTALGNQGFANMMVGETRIAMLASNLDQKGNPDPASRESYTMTRTDRPFVYDWVDCVSNVALRRRNRHDMVWIVVGDEQTKLVSVKEARRLESLRAT